MISRFEFYVITLVKYDFFVNFGAGLVFQKIRAQIIGDWSQVIEPVPNNLGPVSNNLGPYFLKNKISPKIHEKITLD